MVIKRTLMTMVVAMLVLMLLPVPTLAAPVAPTNLVATVQAGPQVALTWTPTANAGHRVMRAVAPGTTFAQVGADILGAITFPVLDNSVAAGVTYSYQIVAFDGTGASAPSNTVTITASAPAAPSGLVAQVQAGPPQAVSLTWADNSTNEIGFRIERATDAGFTANLVQNVVSANTQNFTDTGIAPSTTYSYRVTAMAAQAASAPSNTATAVVPAPAGGMQAGAAVPIAGFGAASGYPAYYQDTLGTKVSLIPADVAINLADPVLTSPPFTAQEAAYSQALGFGTEAFYYLATADTTGFGVGARTDIRFGLEGAFNTIDNPATLVDETGTAAVGQETVFVRNRLKFDVPVSGVYTITTPYHTGANAIQVNAVAGAVGFDVNLTIDIIGPANRDFTTALTGPVNVFLRPTGTFAPLPPAGILGDGLQSDTVTGAPGQPTSLTVTGPGGISFTTNRWFINGRLVATAPVPSFTKTLSPATGLAPNTVTFTDTSTGSPTARLWDFGDGTTSTLANPTHDYTAAGNFIVKLTATNAGGSATASQMVSVFATPGAAFTSAVGATPQALNFTGPAGGNITGWAWDFGDGTTSTLQNPTHVYAAAGTFTVSLRTFNPAGTATSSQVLIVGAPAAPTNLTAVLAQVGTPPVLTANLTWTDNSVNETGFRLEHASNAAFTQGLHTHAIAANVTTFSDAVTPNTTSFWRVFAISGAGDSQPSNTVQIIAAAPTAPAVTATAASSTQVNLSWADVAGESSYRVERATTQAFTTPVVLAPALAANTTTFIDTTVLASTTMFYRVAAVNVVGEAASTVVSATTPAAPTTVPVAPTGLTASLVTAPVGATPGRIDLFWTDASNNESGFRIERDTTPAFAAPVTIATVGPGVTTASDTTVTGAGTFLYRVFAFNAVGNSAIASNTVQVPLTPTTVPAAPTALTATIARPTPGALQVNLAWTNNATDQNSFLIERSTDGTTFTTLATVAANVATFSDTSVTAGSTLFYRVMAVNVVGNSTASNVAQVALTVPAAPTNLAAAAAGPTSVNLAWTSAATNITGFRVERSTDGTTFTALGTVGITATTYNDTTVTLGGTFSYKVFAVNLVGDSAASSVAQVAMLVPQAPANLAAQVITGTPSRVDLTWQDKSNNETGFLVQRSTGGAFATIGTVPAGTQTFSDTNVAAGTTYTYQVMATNVVGSSAASNVASVSIQAVITQTGGQQPQPAATPVPVPTPTPIPPPTIIPEDKVVPITKKEGESTAIVQPSKEVKVELEDKTTITVPPLALPATTQMKAHKVEEKDLPKPVTKGKVRKAIEIEVFDDKGTKIASPEIRLPIVIEVPLTADDMVAIGNDPNNVELHRYDDGLGVWVKLAAQADLPNKVIRAQLRHLSLFAVVVPAPVAQAQPTPTAAPPSAGGAVPGNPAWLVAILVGLGILLLGFIVLRGARQPVKKE